MKHGNCICERRVKSTASTYVQKQARCCTADLTICPEAPKEGPFNSCANDIHSQIM